MPAVTMLKIDVYNNNLYNLEQAVPHKLGPNATVDVNVAFFGTPLLELL